jgi:hypothetical protein
MWLVVAGASWGRWLLRATFALQQQQQQRWQQA